MNTPFPIVKKGRFSVTRYVCANGVLALLDAYVRFRRSISRAFLRSLAIVLSIGLTVVAITSLTALMGVSHSVISLRSDSLVGLESAVSMRGIVREIQLGAFQMQADRGYSFSLEELRSLEGRFRIKLTEYRGAAFDNEDQLNAMRMEMAFGKLIESAEAMVRSPDTSAHRFDQINDMAKTALNALTQAYEYNRKRVNISADEAAIATNKALRIVKIFTWSIGCVMLSLVLIYMLYRWLAMPEETDSL